MYIAEWCFEYDLVKPCIFPNWLSGALVRVVGSTTIIIVVIMIMCYYYFHYYY